MTKQAPEGQGRPMYTNCVCVFKIEKFPCWMSLEAAQHLLNWRSNSYFFLSKALLGICIEINLSLRVTQHSLRRPFRLWLVFGQADRLSKKNSPVVCAEGPGSQASFLAQPQWYCTPLCPCDLGATTTFEAPCFWGEIPALELC